MAFAKYPVDGGGVGTITGPVSSTNNAVALWDGTSGTAIKNSSILSSDIVVITGNQTIGGTKTFSSQPVVPSLSLTDTSNQMVFGSGINKTTLSLPGAPGANLTYTFPNIQNVSTTGTVSMLEAANQTFTGVNTTFTQTVSFHGSSPLFLGDAPNRVVLSQGTQASPRTWLFPDLSTDPTFAALEGTQTFTGSKTFSAANTTFSGANVFLTTDGSLYLGTAPNRVRFLVASRSTTSEWILPNHGSFVTFASLEGTQTFTGVSTMNNLRIGNLNGDILFRSGVNQLTLRAGSSAAARTYTVPDAGTTADFVMTAGTQTIGGTLTLPATVNYTSNGSIVKSGAGDLTLTNASAAGLTFSGAFTLTVPATGTADLIGEAQTISAIKTHSAAITFSGGSAANLSIWAASNVLRQRGGTSGWAVDNTSGNDIISATDAGAVTLGASTNTPYTTFHTTHKNIASGTPGAATDLFGQYSISANCFDTAGYLPTRTRFLTGGRLVLSPRTSDTATTISFRTNDNGDLITSPDKEVVAVTAAGAVTLGPNNYTGLHTVNGPITITRNGTANNPYLRLYNDAENYSLFYRDHTGTIIGTAEATGWIVKNGSGAEIVTGFFSNAGAWTLGPPVSAGVNGVLHKIATGDQGLTVQFTTAHAGHVQFGNSSTSLMSPSIVGVTSDSNINGLGLFSATSDTNSSADMIFDVRENDNTDFATTTNKAYQFRRFGNELASITRAGAVTLVGIHNIGAGNITSGRYTPTLHGTTGGTNISANGTASSCHYSRVGNTVTVTVRIEGTTTTAAVPTYSSMEVSLPIASAMTAADDLRGAGIVIRASGTGIVTTASVFGDSSDDRAVVEWYSQTTSAVNITVTFQYEVK